MLCKCSGKYIDIYFILKITFLRQLFPQLFFFFSLFLSVSILNRNIGNADNIRCEEVCMLYISVSFFFIYLFIFL